jgi:hypothetical protein
MRINGDYHGIGFDSTHPIPSQTLSMFYKRNKKSLMFKKIDRYVKVFEHVDIPAPTTESIIPRRLIIKKSVGRRRKK